MSLKIVRRSLPNLGWGYGPPGEGPFPAIMLLHGSEGGRSGMIYRTAAVLAAHGFLAVAFPYSNGRNGGDIIEVPLDRTAEALSALRSWRLVAAKIGLYGISRGAEHALLLASLMARDGVAGLPDVDGPIFISHGTNDATWSVEMTRRLWDRMKRHGRTPEVHLYEGEGHAVNSDVENQHNEELIDFFARNLSPYDGLSFCETHRLDNQRSV